MLWLREREKTRWGSYTVGVVVMAVLSLCSVSDLCAFQSGDFFSCPRLLPAHGTCCLVVLLSCCLVVLLSCCLVGWLVDCDGWLVAMVHGVVVFVDDKSVSVAGNRSYNDPSKLILSRELLLGAMTGRRSKSRSCSFRSNEKPSVVG